MTDTSQNGARPSQPPANANDLADPWRRNPDRAHLADLRTRRYGSPMAAGEHDNDWQEDEDQFPNARSQARAAAELQMLGERLVHMKEHEVAGLPLDDTLREAVHEARRLVPKTEAMRRQLQFIGKLMRNADVGKLSRMVDDIVTGAGIARHQRQAVQWRDRLLEQSDAGLQAFTQDYPHVDRQQVRQLLRRTLKAPAETKERTNCEAELTAAIRAAIRETGADEE